MKVGARSFPGRFLSLALAGVLVAALAACTGRGGGQLPADGAQFTGRATFGFSFSCERSSNSTNLHPPAGRLHLRLTYADHGSNPLGSRFSIHGVPDPLDPVLESQICIGQNPPPGETELIILGRFRLTGQAPAGFPASCPARETPTGSLCRFEVIVQDNAAPAADFFSIRLSTSTSADGQYTELPDETVFYTRAGPVERGNISIG